MSNVDTSGLPVEMQQRIADIISKAQASAGAAPAQQAPGPTQAAPARPQVVASGERQAFDQAPVQRPPSLMDHTIALRQEVMALREELNAASQVIEAVGQAVGQMYQMFQVQTTATDQSATYSAQFQQQVDRGDDY